MSSLSDFSILQENFEKSVLDSFDLLNSIESHFSLTIIDQEKKEVISSNLKKAEFIIAVVGVVKRGKSTLLNAIIGDKLEVFSTSVTPETAKLSYLTYSTEPSATIYKIDKSTPIQISLEDLPKYTSAYPEKGDFRRRLKGVKELVLATNYAEIRYPNEYLKNNVSLVDTPGVDDVDKERSKVTELFISKADAVILLIDAIEGGLKESELIFIKDRIINKKSNKGIICACNKINGLNPHQTSQLSELLKITRSKLNKELEVEIDVFPIDAKDAYEAKKNGDNELYKRSNFDEFIKSLESALLKNKGKISLKKRLTELEANILLPTLNFLEYRINSNPESIDLLKRDISELEDKIKQQRTSSEKVVEKYEMKIKILIEQVEFQIRKELSLLVNLQNSDISGIQNQLLSKCQYLEQTIRRQVKDVFNQMIIELKAFEIVVDEFKLIIEHPEIVETEYYEDKFINTPKNTSIIGATAGAVIGNMIFPGIGGAIFGGFFGFLFGDSVSDSSARSIRVFDHRKFNQAMDLTIKKLTNSFVGEINKQKTMFDNLLKNWFGMKINDLSNRYKYIEKLKNIEEDKLEEEKAKMRLYINQIKNRINEINKMKIEAEEL